MSMLMSKVQIAAMQRVNIPQEQRVPTYLYVDEFQNFVGKYLQFAPISCEIDSEPNYMRENLAYLLLPSLAS